MKRGFTLAEVLITLVIIGIVAAITVPSMIQTTQKQEFVTALKKANSTLKQSMKLMEINNGYAPGDYSYLKENNNFIEEFAKVTSFMRTCDSLRDCFGRDEFHRYTFLNGVDTQNAFNDGKVVITTDGISYVYAGEKFRNFGLSEEDYNNQIGAIVVDVNGAEKKPNKSGMDVFLFFLVDGKGIVPAGSFDDKDCNRKELGGECAAKVLKEGKINY
ncbi:MAG: type II secretion system protein [Candidatus Gastranaerophilales bacterium]|nr:type II secretion system protein [Candidatus Gastranaerophilales bacterium]